MKNQKTLFRSMSTFLIMVFLISFILPCVVYAKSGTLKKSAYFDGGTYGVFTLNGGSTETLSPDGYNGSAKAVQITMTSSPAWLYLTPTGTMEAGKTYVISAYVKLLPYNDGVTNNNVTANFVFAPYYKRTDTGAINWHEGTINSGVTLDSSLNAYQRIQMFYTYPAYGGTYNIDMFGCGRSTIKGTSTLVMSKYLLDNIEIWQVDKPSVTSCELASDNKTINLSYNVDMDQSIVTSSSYYAIDGSSSNISAVEKQLDGSYKISLIEAINLNTTHTFTITGVKDEWGQLMPTYTKEIKPPVVTETNPANGSAVSGVRNITVSFNNDMNDTYAMNSANYSLQGSNNTIASVTKITDKIYSIGFDSILEGGKDYTFTITGLKDIKDQVLQTYTMTFSTVYKLDVGNLKIYKNYGQDTAYDITNKAITSGTINAVIDKIGNYTSSEKNIAVYVALYNNSILQSVNTASAILAAGNDLQEPIAVSVNVPELNSSSNYEIKGFLWDGDSLKPLCEEEALMQPEIVELSVKPDGTGDFISPKLANDSIADSGEMKQYIINIYPGEYTDINWTVKPYVTLRGTDVNTCWLKGELPDNAALATISGYSTINMFSSANIENLKITAKNMRYAVHDEGSGTNPNTLRNVKNCYIEHQGNAGATTYWVGQGKAASDVWQYTTPYGYGSASGEIETFENTTFKSDSRGWYVHNNANFSKPQVNVISDCNIALTASGKTLDVESLGSGTTDKVILNNCTFSGGQWIQAYDAPWITTTEKGQYADHSDYELTFNNCDPLGYKDSNRGRAMAVFSNTTSGTSSVSATGSAATALLGNYTAKNGGSGLQGYLYGYWDISGILVGLSSNVTVNNTLGKRLGNCTTFNKILKLTFDGDDAKSVTITFNTDYTSMNNDTILSAINSAISAYGTAQSYNVSLNEYYPEFIDKELSLVNGSTVGISRFKAVCYDNSSNTIRCMNESDSADSFVGISLERILPGESGRVLINGYMNYIQLGLGSAISNGSIVYVSGNGGFSLTGSGAAVLTCTNNNGWAYFDAR